MTVEYNSSQGAVTDTMGNTVASFRPVAVKNNVGISYSSEGSSDSPVNLGSIPVEYSGQVNYSSSSYYYATVINGASYTISVTGLLKDADLLVYSDSNFSIEIGYSENVGDTAEESVTVTADGISTIYILVDSTYVTPPGTSFTLSIINDTDPPEFIDAEIVPDYPGWVIASFSEVLANQSAEGFTISINGSPTPIAGISSDYKYIGFSIASPVVQGDIITIQYNADAGSVTDVVENTLGSFGPETAMNYVGLTYTSEGNTDSPVDLGSLPVSYPGEISNSANSYYTVSVTPGSSYNISLTGLSRDADLLVYSDSGFSTEIGYSENLNNEDESVDVIAAGISRMYIIVNSEWVNSPGTTYTISVTEL